MNAGALPPQALRLCPGPGCLSSPPLPSPPLPSSVCSSSAARPVQSRGEAWSWCKLPAHAPEPPAHKHGYIMYTHTPTRTHGEDRKGRGALGKEPPTRQQHILQLCSAPTSSKAPRGCRGRSASALPEPAPAPARLLPRRSQHGALVRCGSDGFVQFEIQAVAAGVQAAVAGFADSAGFEELLAGNGHLLVTAAGAEHVATIPCSRERGEREKK